ncbi:outer membrane beta-barrel protein [Hymenobacter radiodurans]|uniref:outer membrane beta-barrel protein n=1 Tax=Hymenobacter radiodurans TaxID=2496028 RepID=UPI0014042FB0|nr:outer membrane beta-barrel protein [Hymenobacter radiodurans]
MTKALLGFLLLLITSTASYAQLVRLRPGIKVGGNLSSGVGRDVENSKFRVGYHGGATLNLSVGERFSLQTEGLYTIKGDKSLAYGPNILAELRYLDGLALLRYTVTDIFFEAGPQVGRLLSVNSNLASVAEFSVEEGPFRQLEYGYAVGFGYQDPGGLSAGWRYLGGLSNIFKAVQFSETETQQLQARNGALQFYVAYRFFNKNK